MKAVAAFHSEIMLTTGATVLKKSSGRVNPSVCVGSYCVPYDATVKGQDDEFPLLRRNVVEFDGSARSYIRCGSTEMRQGPYLYASKGREPWTDHIYDRWKSDWLKVGDETLIGVVAHCNFVQGDDSTTTECMYLLVHPAASFISVTLPVISGVLVGASAVFVGSAWVLDVEALTKLRLYANLYPPALCENRRLFAVETLQTNDKYRSLDVFRRRDGSGGFTVSLKSSAGRKITIRKRNPAPR
jgi:hypothetical protein